jgi:hypothetical protein
MSETSPEGRGGPGVGPEALPAAGGSVSLTRRVGLDLVGPPAGVLARPTQRLSHRPVAPHGRGRCHGQTLWLRAPLLPVSTSGAVLQGGMAERIPNLFGLTRAFDRPEAGTGSPCGGRARPRSRRTTSGAGSALAADRVRSFSGPRPASIRRPLLGEPWPGVPARDRGATARADACRLPPPPGLTPHGLRHSHKTHTEELGIPAKPQDDRMGTRTARCRRVTRTSHRLCAGTAGRLRRAVGVGLLTTRGWRSNSEQRLRAGLPCRKTGPELVFLQVGVAGFEPTASSSRTKRATKLRHTPQRAGQ